MSPTTALNVETQGTNRCVDPVIEAYKAGIDRTILRHNLRLTPQQRVDAMIELLAMIETCQVAGKEARRARR